MGGKKVQTARFDTYRVHDTATTGWHATGLISSSPGARCLRSPQRYCRHSVVQLRTGLPIGRVPATDSSSLERFPDPVNTENSWMLRVPVS
jgi:hypothetical protein